MRKIKCQVCGLRIASGFKEMHHVIPTEITKEAGLPESLILELCSNCHRELEAWYSTRVSGMAYDTGTKRFESRSLLQTVKEYESAFNSFVKYKKKRTKPS